MIKNEIHKICLLDIASNRLTVYNDHAFKVAHKLKILVSEEFEQ